jgi:hypothetical protein
LSPALRPIQKAHRGQDHYPHEEGVAAFNTLTNSKAHGRLVGYLAAAAVPALGTPCKSNVTIAACSNCKTELFRG